VSDAVLVTGAFGLVGSATVKRLAADTPVDPRPEGSTK
jgi:uncharacterized protein YbjT (DUF2867 family)